MQGADPSVPETTVSDVDGLLVFGSAACLSCATLRASLVRVLSRRTDASPLPLDYIDIGSQLPGSGLRIANVPTVVLVSGGRWTAGWEGFAAGAGESEQDAAVESMLDEAVRLHALSEQTSVHAASGPPACAPVPAGA